MLSLSLPHSLSPRTIEWILSLNRPHGQFPCSKLLLDSVFRTPSLPLPPSLFRPPSSHLLLHYSFAFYSSLADLPPFKEQV